MSVMIQIRNVPERVHRTLKARSALAGKSLSDFIREELVSLAAIPSEEELRARMRDAEPFVMKKSSASIVRQERDAA
ncbi:MAG: FitA-like ribbon-helix-helix domain-containing protein [Rhodanobacteraceae bacterium]